VPPALARRLLTAGGGLAILLGASSAWSEPCVGAPAASRLVEQGDRLFEKSYSVRLAWQSVWMYQQAVKLAPACFEAHWRLARGYSWIAEQEQDTGGNPGLGKKGYEVALRAIQLDPRRVEGHYWSALCIGEYGKGLGVLRAIRQGIHGKFKRHLDAAQRIDRSYDHGGVDRVYAAYYRMVPWPLRDKRESIQRYERSLRYSPRHPRTLLYLADGLTADGRKAEAIARLKLCAAIGEQEGSPRLNRHYLWRCRKRLAELTR
jgi:tetratricopeptide (TPR) repeat protein